MPIVVVLAMSNVSALTEEFQALDRAISRFIPTLIPAHQLDATLLHDKHALIVIHSLANAAMIHLCYRFSQEEPVLYEKSLRAAHACVNIIKHISDADFNFLDPIIGVSCLGVLLSRWDSSLTRSPFTALLELCCGGPCEGAAQQGGRVAHVRHKGH